MEKCISCEESQQFVIETNGSVTDIVCSMCKECVIRIRKMSEGTVELEIAEEYMQ